MEKIIKLLREEKIKEIITSPELQAFLLKAIEVFAEGLGRGFAQELTKKGQFNV
jgi:hypothetical protein